MTHYEDKDNLSEELNDNVEENDIQLQFSHTRYTLRKTKTSRFEEIQCVNNNELDENEDNNNDIIEDSINEDMNNGKKEEMKIDLDMVPNEGEESFSKRFGMGDASPVFNQIRY